MHTADIFGTLRTGSAVTNPFPGTGPDGLAFRDLMHCVTRLDLEFSAENNRKLLKRRSLCWLGPTRRTDHSRDTDRRSARVKLTQKLLDNLWGVDLRLEFEWAQE